MSEKVIFVPGQGMQASKDYPLTCGELQHAGFTVDEVILDWEQRFEDIVGQASADIHKRICRESLIIMHSFGVNVALPGITRHSEIGIVMASPSVACAEGYSFGAGADILEKNFPGQREIVGKFSLAALSQAIQVPPERIAVLVGELEVEKFPFMDSLAKLAAQSVGVEVAQVPGAVHFIEYSSQYRRTVIDTAVQISEKMKSSRY